MKENELIKNLSSGLKPFKATDDLSIYILKWIAYTSVIFILCYIFLPARSDLLGQAQTVRFNIENGLWLMSALFSGIAFYYSCFPQKMSWKTWLPSVISLGTLFVLVLSSFNPVGVEHEFHNELSLWRGRCGFITFIISIIHSGFLGNWARKAAPRDGSSAGFWAALSGSSIGCLFMQAVCAHHNTLHLMLWHFLPMVVICFIGHWVGRTLLRW